MAFVTPKDYYDPSIAFRSPPLGLDWNGWGAGDNKKSLLRSSINGVCLTSLPKVGLTHPTRMVNMRMVHLPGAQGLDVDASRRTAD